MLAYECQIGFNINHTHKAINELRA